MQENTRITGLIFMTFGRARLSICLLLSLVATLTVNAASRAETGHDSLLRILSVFSQVQSSSVYFTEEKFLSTHKNSIRLKGSLTYKRPGYLKKQIDEPYTEVIEISGDSLSLTDYDGYTQQISLQENPQVFLYVSAFRGFLSGDYALLKKTFSMTYEGGVGDWKVIFIPINKSGSQGLKTIIFAGKNAEITKIVIINQQDKSILHLHDKK